MTNRYIIKNCPAILRVSEVCNSYDKALDNPCLCKDCTDCVMKQIVDILRENTCKPEECGMNNFEKIKSLTLDEMAKAIELLRLSDCGVSQSVYDNGCRHCIISKLCRVPMNRIKQWLQAESEV